MQKDNRSMLLAPCHFVSVPHLSKNFDVHFNAVVAESGGAKPGGATRDGTEHNRVIDFSRPRTHIHKTTGVPFEISGFAEEDGAAESYCRWYKPQPGDCVFDAGANCGVSTYYFSKLVGPRGRVIAFEPDRVNRSLLLRNLNRHNLENVTVVDAALAASTGHTSFYCEGTTGSCIERCSPRGTPGVVDVVSTISLRDAFLRWGVPNLCKIDIEGAEVEVIAAAGELLRTTKTHLALDTSHTIAGQLTAPAIESLLRSYGFEVESAPVSGMMTTWARPLPHRPRTTPQEFPIPVPVHALQLA